MRGPATCSLQGGRACACPKRGGWTGTCILWTSSQSISSLLSPDVTFLKSMWPRKRVLALPLRKEEKGKSTHSQAGRVRPPPSFLLPWSWRCAGRGPDVPADPGSPLMSPRERVL